MVALVTRRRALARIVTAAGFVTLPLLAASRPAAAQGMDLPGDVSLPDSGTAPASVPAGQPIAPAAESTDPTDAPSAASASGTTDPAAPLSQVGADDQPADAPAPETAEATPPGPWGVPPIKITIPALGLEAAVEAVGQDPDGAMSAPTDPDEVAWYKLGPGMGVPGNVVLAGHVNWDGRIRTFGYLDKLGTGDVIQIIDEQGRGFEYAVESSHWVRAEGAPLEEIFAQPDEPVITLITCGGEYIASRREYLDRLIVKAKGA